jgi:hypothetical protein
MQLQQMPVRVKEVAEKAVLGIKTNPAIQGIMRYAKLERILAFVCSLIPILLIIFDGLNIRGSISAYYDMKFNQMYYYLLTIAAMMFIVNGVIKQKKFYNTVLGLMLSGVILFNHEDTVAKWFHWLFAIAFFAGNAIVMLYYSSKIMLWVKVCLVFVMAVSLLAWWPLKLITVFWAEWISLLMITIHYLQDINLRKIFMKT